MSTQLQLWLDDSNLGENPSDTTISESGLTSADIRWWVCEALHHIEQVKLHLQHEEFLLWIIETPKYNVNIYIQGKNSRVWSNDFDLRIRHYCELHDTTQNFRVTGRFTWWKKSFSHFDGDSRYRVKEDTPIHVRNLKIQEIKHWRNKAKKYDFFTTWLTERIPEYISNEQKKP